MSDKSRADQSRKIYTILKKKYPDVKITLDFETPFELLIATILSAQCTDERVNIVTKSLFKKYKNPSDYIDVEAEELEDDIRTTGFFRQKTRSIQGTCRMLIEDFDSKVPDKMEDLIKLPGVARKTANIVLGSSLKNISGIAVDTHVKRLANLMGMTEESNPDKIEADLMEQISKKEWVRFSLVLQAHGRAVCKARKPKCADCVVNKLCPSSTA
jgi:endonuclease-3